MFSVLIHGQHGCTEQMINWDAYEGILMLLSSCTMKVMISCGCSLCMQAMNKLIVVILLLTVILSSVKHEICNEHEIWMETCFTLALLSPIQLRLLFNFVVLQLWSCIWGKCLVLLLSNHKMRGVKCWSAIQWFSHLSPPSFLSHCVANKE